MLNTENIRRVCLPVLALMLTLGGCTPYATYPPVGQGEIAVPWMHPIPQVMGKALGNTYQRTSDSFVSAGTPADLVFSLPEGITTGVWTRVGVDTGVENARMARAEDLTDGTPIWSVEQVRIRNRRAEVDVIYPTPGGAYLRATVIFEADPFKAYQVSHFQRWRTEVDNPLFSLPVDLPSDEDDDGASEDAAGVETETAPAVEE